MRWLRHPVFHWILGAVLGVVFVYASLEKIAQPREFARIVYHYRLLGPSQDLGFLPANTLAVVLPWVEAVAGVLLIAGIWRREAALVVAILLALFVVAVGYALYHNIDVQNCGCFSVGAEGRRAGWGLLGADLALLAAALALVIVRPRPVATATATEATPALTTAAGPE